MPRAPSIGTIDMGGDLAAVVREVGQEAIEVRQVAYETTVEALGKSMTPAQIRDIALRLGRSQLARIVVENPKAATELIRAKREEME